jgi:hypothetical protein
VSLSATQEIATKQVPSSLSIISETAKDQSRIFVGYLNLFLSKRIFALSFVATFVIDIEDPSEKISLK